MLGAAASMGGMSPEAGFRGVGRLGTVFLLGILACFAIYFVTTGDIVGEELQAAIDVRRNSSSAGGRTVLNRTVYDIHIGSNSWS